MEVKLLKQIPTEDRRSMKFVLVKESRDFILHLFDSHFDHTHLHEEGHLEESDQCRFIGAGFVYDYDDSDLSSGGNGEIEIEWHSNSFRRHKAFYRDRPEDEEEEERLTGEIRSTVIRWLKAQDFSKPFLTEEGAE